MTLEKEKDELLDRTAAAKYLGGEKKPLAVGTLAVWDCTKRYDLKPIKVGRSVRYKRSVLDQFLRERQRPDKKTGLVPPLLKLPPDYFDEVLPDHYDGDYDEY